MIGIRFNSFIVLSLCRCVSVLALCSVYCLSVPLIHPLVKQAKRDSQEPQKERCCTFFFSVTVKDEERRIGDVVSIRSNGELTVRHN